MGVSIFKHLFMISSKSLTVSLTPYKINLNAMSCHLYPKNVPFASILPVHQCLHEFWIWKLPVCCFVLCVPKDFVAHQLSGMCQGPKNSTGSDRDISSTLPWGRGQTNKLESTRTNPLKCFKLI